MWGLCRVVMQRAVAASTQAAPSARPPLAIQPSALLFESTGTSSFAFSRPHPETCSSADMPVMVGVMTHLRVLDSYNRRTSCLLLFFCLVHVHRVCKYMCIYTLCVDEVQVIMMCLLIMTAKYNEVLQILVCNGGNNQA